MKNFQLSALNFTLVSALFLLLTQNTLFFTTLIRLTEVKRAGDLLFIVVVPVMVFFALNICLTFFSLPYVRRVFMAVFLAVGPVVVYYMYSYNILIDADMIRNVFQTNYAETFELLSLQFVFLFLFLGFLPAVFFLKIRIKPEPSLFKALQWRLLNISLSFLLLSGLFFFTYKDCSSFFRNYKWTLKQLVPSNYISGLYNYYDEYREKHRRLVQIGLDAEQGELLRTAQKPLLFVFVAGEAARAQNFSLGSYERETNPLLSREDLIYFDGIKACNTSTATSLPCLFSDRPRVKYKSADAYFRENALDIVQRAGIDVLWIGNNGGCKGICGRVQDIIIRDKDRVSSLCSGGSCWDSILEEKLETFVTQLDAGNDAMVILHQIGSHGPAYYKRYPPEYRYFSPTCDTNIIKDCTTEALVNTYDNTLLYTDAMLSSLINLLKEKAEDYLTVLVYTSDHGESLGENGLFLHATPYPLAPDEQLKVPLIFWVSAEYADSFNIDMNCLRDISTNASEFSHDNIFHTILGIMDVRASEYEPKLDLVGQCRK